MKELVTELLREKFVIHDLAAGLKSGQGPTIALSNRMVVALKNEKGETQETLIVRAQNMHSCIRMAARMVQSFISGGPLLDRPSPYDWQAAWDLASGEYEQNYNPQRWVAIYHGGKVVFEKGDRHPMLDIIEKCSEMTKGKYEDSIQHAEEIIRKQGRVLRLEYDGNVALVINLEKKQGRCGVILRSADKTRTFNFSVAAKGGMHLNFAQILGSGAAFLEGIQLAFSVGMNGEKIKRGIIARHSPEEKQTRESEIRLGRLNSEIANLETTFDVRYRPEKPEFPKVLAEAEELARKVLPAPGKKP
ncbi:MAG: hypothetical protein WBK55_05200 [Alphaproteobacteria bacterium]